MEDRQLIAYTLLLLILVMVPAAVLFSNEAWRERFARRRRSRQRRKERLREETRQG